MQSNTKAIESGQNKPEQVDLPTSSRNVIIMGFVFIGLFFGGLGGWAATSKLKGAVIAPGDIIVESYRKQVQHLDGGIVKEILVRDGDFVEMGQVLLRLDGERVLATRDMHRARMDSLLAQQARIVAEVEGRDEISWPEQLLARQHMSDVLESMRSEEMIFRSRLEAKNSRIALLRSRISRQQSMQEGYQSQMSAILDTIESLKEEIAAKEPLLEGGFIDISHIMQLQRTLNSNQSRIEELKTQTRQAREMVAELHLEIRELEKRYSEEATSQLGNVRQAIVDLREQLRPVEDASRRLEVKAPESGIVVNLNVRTEGGVIQGGAPLMEIVPVDSGLIVSARVEPSKIDDVHLGQTASVSLTAFPMRYTPKVTGRVTYVSADKVEPRQQGMPPYYQVYVEFDHDSLINAIGDKSRLTPGMPAQVFIQTREKTVLGYLMTPITDSINRAFRE